MKKFLKILGVLVGLILLVVVIVVMVLGIGYCVLRIP